MEPPRTLWASLWNFICFLPFFIGLLILGFIKGIIMFPVILLIVTIGISGIILILWPIHFFYTYYCILSTRQFGPVLKLLICTCLVLVLISWPPLGIACSILFGAGYGLFAPILATFRAVEQGKTSKFSHCICDGTWSTVERSFTVMMDFSDVCYHSYFSIMDDLLHQEGKRHEIRLLYVLPSLIAGILGLAVDLPVISTIALCKSPWMLVKGWQRLLHDCIGREGPFLETICVPFAGLAVLLWPLVVAGAVLCSIASTLVFGGYAVVVVYQESSFWYGLCYIAASLSIYDEYSNDVLDLPQGSCFPRPRYREKAPDPSSSVSNRGISEDPPCRRVSFGARALKLKPSELADSLFKECQRQGEVLVEKGVLKLKDIEESKRRRSCGLPAYCILQTLVHSARANSNGILMSDDVEITTANRPKDAFFEWFLNPLLIIKDQIRVHDLSETEEEYLGKLVLFTGSKNPGVCPELESEVRRAEIEAVARRLIGITKSILRYPTLRRRFDRSLQIVLAQLARKNGNGDGENQTMRRSTSMFARIFTQKPSRCRTTNRCYDQEDQTV